MQTTLDRLRFLVQKLAIGKYTVFAKSCNIPLSTFKNYYDGQSKPNAEHLGKIYSVYKVNLNWLLVGDGEPFIQEGGSVVDLAATSPGGEDIMREIIMAVEEWLNRRGLTLAPAKKADLVIELYRHFREKGGQVDKDTIERFFLQIIAINNAG